MNNKDGVFHLYVCMCVFECVLFTSLDWLILLLLYSNCIGLYEVTEEWAFIGYFIFQLFTSLFLICFVDGK